jgi:hypothetical protein
MDHSHAHNDRDTATPIQDNSDDQEQRMARFGRCICHSSKRKTLSTLPDPFLTKPRFA